MSSNRSAEHRDVFVLSGGAARGAVQVGMLQVLLSAGIRPSGFVGTSVGALNAAFMGADATADRARDLGERWLRLRTRDIFPGGAWSRLAHLAQRHPYLFSSSALRELIHDWVPARKLEELPTPVRVTTTPLGSAAADYHDAGDLAALLLASAAVPGVFAPVDLQAADGRLVPHVDGGVADLVPVAGAVGLAPTRIFVLDATVPARLPRARTPIEVLVASLGVAMRARPLPDLGPSVEVHHVRTADLGTGMTDFTRTADHIRLGVRAAEEALTRICAPGTAVSSRRRRWHLFSHAA